MEKQISNLKLISFILILVVTVQTFGTVLFFRQSNQIAASNLKKIDSLIDELGEVKSENQILSDQLTNQLNNKNSALNELQNNYQAQAENLNNLQSQLALQTTHLSSEKTDLANQLNQKQQELQKLQNQKAVSAQFDQIESQIYSILFLGTNQKLTDSIQLAVINKDKQQITLISIPRDLYFQGRKINEYLELYGVDKTKEVIEKVTGIKPSHYVTFNFQSFVDLVDSLGGIYINIDRTITDSSYPTSDGGYKTVKFTEGYEEMNGNRALEYARSRKSTSDFDRSLRQQKIIIAIKEKIKTLGLESNLDFYLKTFDKISANTETDLNIFDIFQLYNQYQNYSLAAGNILSNQNFLYSSKSVTGQSILLPKNQSYLSFQQKLLEII